MMYMFYLDRLDRERKKRLHDLEFRCKSLAEMLSEAEVRIEEQNGLLDALYKEIDEGEVWADVLDDR